MHEQQQPSHSAQASPACVHCCFNCMQKHRVWAGLLCLPALLWPLFRWGIAPLHSQNLLVLNSPGQGRSSWVEPEKQQLTLSTQSSLVCGHHQIPQTRHFFSGCPAPPVRAAVPHDLQTFSRPDSAWCGCQSLGQLPTLSRRKNPTWAHSSTPLSPDFLWTLMNRIQFLQSTGQRLIHWDKPARASTFFRLCTLFRQGSPLCGQPCGTTK